MDAKTLEALQGSIEKWRKIVEGTGVDGGHDNCPLCQMFNPEVDSHCAGCPVAQAVNKIRCSGTPYAAWCASINNVGWSCADTPKRIEAARAELAFLESLLPSAGTATP